MTDRPIIALEVDGVLLPFGQPPVVNPEHGPWLQSLAEHADLVWATSWMHQANTDLAPALGLPNLPVVEKGSVPGYGRPRRLIWIDDAFHGLRDPESALERPTGRDVLFVGPHPRTGLRDTHINVILYWITGQYPD